MPQPLRINLARPIAAVRIVDAAEGQRASGDSASSAEIETILQKAKAQEATLEQLSQTLRDMTGKLDTFYQETIAKSRSDIAKLAVEIARKILMRKTEQGDYDIQAIVEETLKQAPTRQEIVIRLNPEDVALCQQALQENPDSPLAGLELVCDWGIARANCLIETPKGIVKTFVDECLERVAHALERTQ